jgi:hypothetical protein
MSCANRQPSVEIRVAAAAASGPDPIRTACRPFADDVGAGRS